MGPGKNGQGAGRVSRAILVQADGVRRNGNEEVLVGNRGGNEAVLGLGKFHWGCDAVL